MIPKIIHYCWLSDDPIPEVYKNYIEEWHRIMPDYKIKKWDRTQINLNEHPFAKSAYDAKKYAFAADYIRVYALMTEGGIYLDSDVKLIKNLDMFNSFRYFSAFENHWDEKQYRLLFGRYISKEGSRLPKIKKIINVGIQAAIIGCEPNHPLIVDLWHYYKSQLWNDNGCIYCDNPEHTAPTVHSRFCEKYGFKYLDKIQLLNEGILILPSEILATSGIRETNNTCAVHMCANSWNNKKSPFKDFLKNNRWIFNLYLRIKLLLRIQK